MRERFDVVFMDVDMPVVNGFEAARAIREREGAARRTPIVALTASAFPGDADACRDAGMDDFLAKPFSSDELCAVLARWTVEGVERTPAS